MTLSKIGSKLVVIVAIGAVAAVPAMAHHSGHGGDSPSLKLSLAPSVPTDPSFHAVAPGGAPWVLRRGDVKVSDARLDLRVRGLVIPVAPGNGTPGPVNTISASLYCSADADTAPADTTGQ